MSMNRKALLSAVLLVGVPAMLAAGCHPSPPSPGPDKQFSSGLRSAVTGAGAGAVTGFQLGSGTGPGALVGAGFGMLAGGVQGYFEDLNDENLLALRHETDEARAISHAQELLNEHYRRRLELHPARDIFPADWFFCGDSVKLRPGADILVREIALMNRQRLPWSRLAVTVYAKSADPESDYGRFLTRERAEALTNQFVISGLEPRRIEARGMLIDAPILIDPFDDPLRYNQAIELIPLDR